MTSSTSSPNPSIFLGPLSSCSTLCLFFLYHSSYYSLPQSPLTRDPRPSSKFSVLQNLKAQPELNDNSKGDSLASNPSSNSNDCPRSSKVISAIGLGFWTCVDMASDRYLWRNLIASKRAD